MGLAGANPLFKVVGSSVPYCLSIVPGTAIFGYKACVSNIRRFYNENVKGCYLAPSARRALIEQVAHEGLDKAVNKFCVTCCCSKEEVKEFEVTLAILRVFVQEVHKDLAEARGDLSRILADMKATRRDMPMSHVEFENLDDPQ